jgi:predicted nucleic acid-binding protein
MTTAPQQLMPDCSVLVKWKISTEPHAAEAREMLHDWESGAIALCAPDQLRTEIIAAFLKALRQQRLTEDEARQAVRESLALALKYYKTTPIVLQRAFDIAWHYGLRPYDCIYVAMAERKKVEFWTGDQRLFNALRAGYSFIHWIGNYQKRRP